MTSTIVVVLVMAAAIGWPAAPPPRNLSPLRSAAPDPHFWGWSAAERGGVASLVAVLVGFALGSPAAMVVAPIMVMTVARQRARRQRARIEGAHAESLLEFVDAMVAGLRAGGSLSGSMVTAAETGLRSSRHELVHPGLQRVIAGLAAGRPLPAAVADSFSGDGRRRPDEELLTVTVIALDASGGSAAEAIDRVGDTLRERCAARADARTQAQQAISSAAVMAALPLVFGLAAAVAEPAVGHLYLSTWVGAVCASTAVAISVLGWEWQQRLIEGRR